jgi:hypothetical protein
LAGVAVGLVLLLHEHSDTLSSMIENVTAVDEEPNEETEVEDDVDDGKLEDALTAVVACSACTGIGLDVDVIIHVLDVSVLVLKAVKTTASTVVELDITVVASVVKVAVGTKHSTVPDC